MSSLKSSITVGIFQSLSFCGLRQKILKNIAFQPPKVSYSLKPRLEDQMTKSTQTNSSSLQVIESEHQKRQKSKSYDDENIHQSGLLDLAEEIMQFTSETSSPIRQKVSEPAYDFYLIDGQGQEIPIPKQENLELTGYFLKGRKAHRIASLYLKYQFPASDYVMLFSHGNASDLGYMIDTLIDLCSNLRINIFAYEYSGYGLSQGKCTDLNIINNIQVAYEFLVSQLNFDPTKIIVYGYSIGSGPSVMLVSDIEFPVGGLVVHSGLSSGLRVLNSKIKQTPFYDIFPNVDRIKDVTCPVFIMHGKEDEIIDLHHATLLSNNCQRLYEYWEVENIGHQGIDTNDEHRKNYFYKLRDFIKLIQQENQTIKELKQRNTASPKQFGQHNHYYDNKIREFHLSCRKVEDSEQFPKKFR
ncbi:hypothetical protein (macronuclear) [Paramecium tetraurelia strain d4-2]|uniref:Serine aminopeptidase S33 domain-containing protein n=1 Tax=Paramecium tetraurelia TaxID=5888 RepID=Q6BFL6_PARTE|nr:hypothetical protein [Paramecium tetraurelia strain d4-2]CAH03554.1 Conserved hypothetical protein, alpha/beta hydrolase family [Paramecium tetraurelia]